MLYGHGLAVYKQAIEDGKLVRKYEEQPEVMAILCLSKDIIDLKRRLGKIIVGYRKDNSPIFASDLKAEGSMAVLLKDAMMPNLVQTNIEPICNH